MLLLCRRNSIKILVQGPTIEDQERKGPNALRHQLGKLLNRHLWQDIQSPYRYVNHPGVHFYQHIHHRFMQYLYKYSRLRLLRR